MYRIFLILFFILFLPLKANSQEDNKISILHINDANGNINPINVDGKYNAGGILKIADFVRNFRKKNSTLFIASGDMIAPIPDSAKNKGNLYLDFFNAINLDIWSPGNYDLLYGFDNLKKLTDMAKFPVINSNLFYKGTDKNIFKPYTIIEKNNHKILFLGVTNLGSYNQLPNDVQDNIEVRNPLETINNLLENIKEKYDFTILIAQLDNEEKAEILKKTKIDLIIGSLVKYSEADLINFSTFNNKYSAMTLGYATSIGQINLKYNKEYFSVENLKNNFLIEEGNNEDVSDINDIIKKYRDDSDKKILASFSKNPSKLDTYQFINSSLHKSNNCEITAIPNNFFIRSYYFDKEISEHDIFSIIPMPSKLEKIKINGSDFNNYIKNIDLNNYTFSGYSDGKVNNVSINNTENYTLCTTEQEYNKNTVLKAQKNKYSSSEPINKILYKYILDNKGKEFNIDKKEEFDNWKFTFSLDLDPQILNINLKDNTEYNYLTWKGDKNAISWGGVSNLFLRRYWDTNEFDNKLSLEFRQQQVDTSAIEKFADSIQFNSIFKKKFFNNFITPFAETKISSFFVNPDPNKPYQILLELNTGLWHELPFGFKLREGLEIRKSLLDPSVDWKFGGFTSLNFNTSIFYLIEEFEGKLYLPIDGKIFITEIKNKITYPISNLFNLYYQINLYNETFDFSKIAIRQNAGINIKFDTPFSF